MSEALTLSAETRERAGKGASRAMRREGRVPAVIYGNNEDPCDGPRRGEGADEAPSHRPLHELGHHGRRRRQRRRARCPRTSSSIRSPIGRFMSISCAFPSTPRSPSRVPVRFEQRGRGPGPEARRRAQRRAPRPRARSATRPRSPTRSSSTSRASTSAIRSTSRTSRCPSGAVSAIDDRDFTIATIVAPSAMKSEEGDTQTAPEAGEVPTVGEEEGAAEGGEAASEG